jgi:transposase
MEMRAARRFRSRQERRQIVEETLKPGASVSQVARAHDINANQVFHWRRQYRAGWFDDAAKPGALLPVKISTSVSAEKPSAAERGRNTAAESKPAGTIEIEIGSVRMRIEGAADADCVRAALDRLLR